MQSRSRIISSIRTLCGEAGDAPLSEGGLPTSLIFEELVGIESMMLRDLNLSTKSARVAKAEIDLGQDDESFTVPQTDFHTPAYAYLRTDQSSDFWYPVEIAEQPSLGQLAVNGTLAIAFSGTPRTGYFSWIPDGTQTLRIWYERDGDDAPTMAGSTELGNLYDEYLKLQCAAQCREHLKMELGQVLSARLAKSERQWRDHVTKGQQRGLGSKTPSLNIGKRHFGPYGDRTRFFIPWR